MVAAVTFELEIRFAAAGGAGLKKRLLAALAELGVGEYAEGVIDGVDIKVEDGDGAEPFALDDATPVLVFDYDRAKLGRLTAELELRFGRGLTLKLNELLTESWTEAWGGGDRLIVTERFVVLVGGRELPPGNSKIPLEIASGAAFGDGRHATTEAALKALEALPASTPRGPMLDVGTGTGILAIAASHLGFGPLLGTDIDAEVLAEAEANAKLNGVALQLLNAPAPPVDGTRYALIAANILVPVLHHVLAELRDLLAPNGRIVLAGFVEKEAVPLVALAMNLGLVEESRCLCRGWVGLILRRA